MLPNVSPSFGEPGFVPAAAGAVQPPQNSPITEAATTVLEKKRKAEEGVSTSKRAATAETSAVAQTPNQDIENVAANALGKKRGAEVLETPGKKPVGSAHLAAKMQTSVQQWYATHRRGVKVPEIPLHFPHFYRFVAEHRELFKNPEIASTVKDFIQYVWESRAKEDAIFTLKYREYSSMSAELYQIIQAGPFLLGTQLLLSRINVSKILSELAGIDLKSQAYASFVYSEPTDLDPCLEVKGNLRIIEKEKLAAWRVHTTCTARLFLLWTELFTPLDVFKEPQINANLVKAIVQLARHALLHFTGMRLLRELDTCRRLCEKFGIPYFHSKRVHTLKFLNGEKQLNKLEMALLSAHAPQFSLVTQGGLIIKENETQVDCSKEEFERFFDILINNRANLLQRRSGTLIKNENVREVCVGLFPIIKLADRFCCQSVLKDCFDAMRNLLESKECDVETIVSIAEQARASLLISETIIENWQDLHDCIFSFILDRKTNQKDFNACLKKMSGLWGTVRHVHLRSETRRKEKILAAYRVEALLKLPHLQKITFSYLDNFLKAIDLNVLKQMPNLTEISLQGYSGFDSYSLPGRVLTPLPNLTVFRMQHSMHTDCWSTYAISKMPQGKFRFSCYYSESQSKEYIMQLVKKILPFIEEFEFVLRQSNK